MRRVLSILVAALPFTLAGVPAAYAVLHPGDAAFNWTKTELGTGISRSQNDYLGKVVVLFPMCYD